PKLCSSLSGAFCPILFSQRGIMANWYFVNAKTRDKSGPHEESFVRAKFIAGEIRPETPVWHDGLAHWIPASQAFSALQAPGGIEGRVPRPDGLLGWMTFVGVMTILVAIPPSLMLYGLPLLFAGIAALSARAALRRTPFVSPDMIPFLSKLKTFFSCLGWMYIIGMFIFVVVLLIHSAMTIWALSSGAPHFLSEIPTP
ncbi:MAG: DUF4339 domain-containing protein, partial [Kiritimatiellia bacterium]